MLITKILLSCLEAEWKAEPRAGDYCLTALTMDFIIRRRTLNDERTFQGLADQGLAQRAHCVEAPNPLTWKPVSEARYWQIAKWCWPKAADHGGLLGVDLVSHRTSAVSGRSDDVGTYTAVIDIGDRHYQCLQDMTVAEFYALDPREIEIEVVDDPA